MSSILLPMLASDANLSKVRFPCWIQPKIDGVRGLYLLPDGFTGRSLKAPGNKYTTQFFSWPEFRGLDGEMAAEHECNPDLCRITTSATSSYDGSPWLLWHVFDYVTPETLELKYRDRYGHLVSHVESLRSVSPDMGSHLKVVPYKEVTCIEELEYWETKWLEEGYEGLIIRDPDGLYKSGRSTVREGGLLRIKRFVEEDVMVLSVLEGEVNENEAQVNELGKTFRSTHQDNMTASGMVGTLLCLVVKDIKDPYTGKVLFKKGQEIKVGPGKMSHADRVYYFEHPEELISAMIKFKFFPKGIKDKPRFPTYVSHRAKSDMEAQA